MRGFFRRFSILFRSIALSITCLASCSEQSNQAERDQKSAQSEQAREPHCKQIASLFAMSDWDSLATEQFKTEKTNDGTITTMRAPARSIIVGSDKCEIARTTLKVSSGLFSLDTLTYGCRMPVPNSAGDDALVEAKAFAAPWESCVTGWQQNSTLHPDSTLAASVSFHEKDKTLIFSTSVKPVRSNTIGFGKNETTLKQQSPK